MKPQPQSQHNPQPYRAPPCLGQYPHNSVRRPPDGANGAVNRRLRVQELKVAGVSDDDLRYQSTCNEAKYLQRAVTLRAMRAAGLSALALAWPWP